MLSLTNELLPTLPKGIYYYELTCRYESILCNGSTTTNNTTNKFDEESQKTIRLQERRKGITLSISINTYLAGERIFRIRRKRK